MAPSCKLYLTIAIVNIFCTILTILFTSQFLLEQSKIFYVISTYISKLLFSGANPSLPSEPLVRQHVAASPQVQSSRSMSSEGLAPSLVNGLDYLRDPKLFKGMAFSLEERQTLGIHGLLPPRIKSLDEQAENCMRNLRRFQVFRQLSSLVFSGVV